jgi:single stranded DNA-binding protein
MAGDTTITVIGNLTDDPELRFTPSGAAVAKFRVASTPRFMDRQTNEWKDGEPLFLACTVWRQAAENVAESLQRGARVIVSGRLKQRSYETREGEKRTVAPSLDTYLNVIRTSGGSVEKLDVWGRRRLAYEIEKKTEGIYAVIDLQATPAAVAELDRQLRLNESVLRTKVIRPEVR